MFCCLQNIHTHQYHDVCVCLYVYLLISSPNISATRSGKVFTIFSPLRGWESCGKTGWMPWCNHCDFLREHKDSECLLNLWGLIIRVQKFTKHAVNLKRSLTFLQNIQGQSRLGIYKQVKEVHLPLNSSCPDMTQCTYSLTNQEAFQNVVWHLANLPNP